MAVYVVTGGCGFIGSHLVEAIVAAGHGVRVLDDLSTGTPDRLPHEAELVIGDVRDRAWLRRAVEGADGCFHLAAVASVSRCNERWLDSHDANLSATVALFEAASAGGRRFPVVYASSAAVYGDQTTMPLREEAPLRPRSPYGADKAGCELHAQAGAAVRDLAAIGLRFFNVYGPGQRPDSARSAAGARAMGGSRGAGGRSPTNLLRTRTPATRSASKAKGSSANAGATRSISRPPAAAEMRAPAEEEGAVLKRSANCFNSQASAQSAAMMPAARHAWAATKRHRRRPPRARAASQSSRGAIQAARRM